MEISWAFIFILSIITCLIIILYFYLIKPYFKFIQYGKSLKKLGYKVHIHPFRPFGSNFRTLMKQSLQKYGDSAHFVKNLYPNFDIVLGNILDMVTIELINPDLIKQFYKNANQNNYIKADVITSSFKLLLNNGILMKQGDQWKQRKKILSSVFTHDFLVSLIPEIDKISISKFEQMDIKFSKINDFSKKQTIQVNLHLILQQIFSQIIVRLFFGVEPTENLQGKNICQFINSLIQDLIKQRASIPFILLGEKGTSRKLKSKAKSFKLLATNLIKQRLKTIQQNKVNITHPRDIIEALVLSGQFQFVQGQQIKHRQGILNFDDLIGQFCTFFIAGMDTTSNLTISIIYHLAKQSQSQILLKLRQEVDQILNQKQLEHLCLKDLKKMTYTELIQKEGLRMYSPVNGIFARKAIKSHKLKDIQIQEGIAVVARNRANFYDEQYFPNPHKFDPQRWRQNNHKLHPYAFLPFSSGARTCIGNHLALMQNKIVMTRFLQRYKKMALEKEDYKMVNRFLYSPQRITIKLEK